MQVHPQRQCVSPESCMKKLLSPELGFAGFFHLFGTHVAGKYFFGAHVTPVGRAAGTFLEKGTAGEQQGGCDQYGIKSKFFHEGYEDTIIQKAKRE